jgi:hypothetical protein
MPLAQRLPEPPSPGAGRGRQKAHDCARAAGGDLILSHRGEARAERDAGGPSEKASPGVAGASPAATALQQTEAAMTTKVLVIIRSLSIDRAALPVPGATGLGPLTGHA